MASCLPTLSVWLWSDCPARDRGTCTVLTLNRTLPPAFGGMAYDKGMRGTVRVLTVGRDPNKRITRENMKYPPSSPARLSPSSVVIGVDVHKYSHSAVAMDAWGQEKGRLEFNNETLSDYTLWLKGLGQQSDIIVGLEDANCYGVHIAEKLRKEGFFMRSVPAILTERERKHSTKREKSDYEDAKRVGKVILTKYEETLPAKESIADEDELRIARELDLLLMERRDLVKQKTILKNQLHGLLHQYYGDHYRNRFKKPFCREAVAFWLGDLEETAKAEEGLKRILASGIIRRIHHLGLTEEQITVISSEISTVGAHSPAVAALSQYLHGCGTMTAAAITAELITIKRFPSRDALAMYAGVAPRRHSSGRHDRLYTNPFGNRLLNRALHTVALSQIAVKGDTRGKEYYQKKLQEGKTKLWALRCLKRQIVNQVFRTLRNQLAAVPIA